MRKKLGSRAAADRPPGQRFASLGTEGRRLPSDRMMIVSLHNVNHSLHF
ncbi:MAG: hypothetical protein OXG58_04600 [Gemmatimonadetes bacterium]|nr:hypothetical protein [Gemmatimonadota bacterium]MCY3943686.1 hypothetical protein [Gemmatimonadota bacterium]